MKPEVKKAEHIFYLTKHNVLILIGKINVKDLIREFLTTITEKNLHYLEQIVISNLTNTLHAFYMIP